MLEFRQLLVVGRLICGLDLMNGPSLNTCSIQFILQCQKSILIILIIYQIGQMPSLFNKKSSIPQSHTYHHQQIPSFLVKDIEKTMNPHNHLPGKNKCECEFCLPGRFPQKQDLNIFKSNSKQSSKWFKTILDGLTIPEGKTLRLFLPDIFFVNGQTVQIYQTSRKDSRIVKSTGLTSLKHVYPIFVKMRKQYNNLLEQNYNNQMLDKINPEYMPSKYYQKLVPSHFHDGNQSHTLQNNKHQFKRYILHNSSKYQIPQIQQHKMNEKQPFCLIKYNDGNCQLFNQAEFQVFSLSPLPKLQQVSFFQSYIKYKQQKQSIIYSEYTYSPTTVDIDLDIRAQKQVMILLGGITRYDDDYKDIETLEQLSIDLMFNNHKEYVNLMTYKIIHFLAMAGRTYIVHIKLKWILTDIGTIYLQEILQMNMSQFSHRFIKYRIPLLNQSLGFYKSNEFVETYKEMGRRKVINTLIIKKDIDQKTFKEINQIMNSSLNNQIGQYQSPKSQRQRLPSINRSKAVSSTSKTIDMTQKPSLSPTNFQTIEPKRVKFHNFSTYEEHLKQHPEIIMKNRRYNNITLGKYTQEPHKIQKIDRKINNHFIFNMSNEDYKTFGNPSEPKSKPHSPQKQSLGKQLSDFLDKRNARISQSVLYNTFHQQNSERLKEVNQTLNHQKISKRYKLSQSIDEN